MKRPCIFLIVWSAAIATADGQTDWARVAAGAPGGRSQASMAYYPEQQAIVLFGGYQGGQTVSSETWLWDGTVWRRPTPARVPQSRSSHGLVYHRARRTVVLFGGATIPDQALDDTWEWNGQNWRLATTGGLPARFRHAMAYDIDRDRVVVFGGADGTGFGRLGDTWEWDGTSWKERISATSPSARIDASMVYDPVRRRVVLFGGGLGTLFQPPFDDTWEWDGQSWTRRDPARRPQARFIHAMVYDDVRSRVIVFGGLPNLLGPELDDTWEWDGTDWTQRMPATRPWARSGSAAAFEPTSGRTILYGGFGVDPATGRLEYADDTWAYAPIHAAAYAPFGASCTGTTTPRLAARTGQRPWAGDVFAVDLADLPPGQPVVMITGFSDSAWGSFRLPLPLDGIGMRGCSLYTEPAVDTGLGNAGGTVTWTVPLPLDPGVLGLRFYNQGIVFDPGANALGIIATNGGAGVIGGR